MLAQLSALLHRTHGGGGGGSSGHGGVGGLDALPRLQDVRSAWARCAATDAASPLERTLFGVGLSAAALERVTQRFGSEERLRATYSACVSEAAARRLLCPLIEEEEAEGAPHQRCTAGVEAPCCRLSAAVHAALAGTDGTAGGGRSADADTSSAARATAAAGVIDLTEDAAAMELVQGLGYRQAPVVVAGDDHWAGFRPDMINRLS